MTTKIVNHKKDDAVSPVVGVMLMLVVTIVIAAVVALFATSIVTDMDAAPVAVIQMDAYAGEPDVNSDLCMSIIGGKALELSKLKCVVTVEDGKYGLVFKSLDTDPVVGKFLEIGEKLEIFNFDSANGGMRKINSLVGGDIKTQKEEFVNKILEEWKVGNKVNVMIVFNEDAILYKKDIIIQDGNHGGVIVNPDLKNGSIAIAEKDGSEIATITPDSGYSIKADSVQVLNASTGADLSIALNLTKVTNGDKETWMFDKPTVPVMVTCEFVSEGSKATFNICAGSELSKGDTINVSQNGKDLFTKTLDADPTRVASIGTVDLSVGSVVKISIKSETILSEGEVYQIHTNTHWSTGADMSATTGGTYNYEIEYTIDEDDVDTPEGFDTTNPIAVDIGVKKKAGYTITLGVSKDGEWSGKSISCQEGNGLKLRDNTDATYSLICDNNGTETEVAKFTIDDDKKSQGYVVKSAMLGDTEILGSQFVRVTKSTTLTLTTGVK